MEEWPLLFRGSAESCEALAKRLERSGLHSFVVPEERFSWRGEEFAAVHLHVPPDEQEAAGRELEAWQAQARVRSAALARRLRRVLLLATLAPIAWGAAAAVAPDAVPAPGVAGLVAAWLVAVVGVGQIERRRHLRERVAMPTDAGVG